MGPKEKLEEIRRIYDECDIGVNSLLADQHVCPSDKHHEKMALMQTALDAIGEVLEEK